MPVNLSIKNAPDELVARLKERAQRNHRSLQGEMLSILEGAVQNPGTLNISEVWEKAQRLGLKTEPSSVSIIRADRDSR